MTSNRLSMRASMSDSGARVLPEMFKNRLFQIGEETLDSLRSIWKEAGYEEVECQRLLGELLNKLRATCTAELAAEQQILEHAKMEVKSKSAEYTDYCEQLGRQAKIDYLASLNYTDKLAELERLINIISVEVSQRQQLLDKEVSKINTLVEYIGEGSPKSNAFDGPAGTPKLSDIRLNLMKQYIIELETVKEKRIEEVKNLTKDCYKHMTDLMYAEENFKTMGNADEYLEIDKKIDKFHRNSIGADLNNRNKEFTFSIHKKDIHALTLRLKSFVEEKDRRRQELGEIGTEIARLWTLLRIPSAEREQFQTSFKMNLSMETLSKGIDELNRLRELRAQSLGKVIATMREDIAILWQEAGIEGYDSQYEEFALYFTDADKLEDEAVRENELLY